MRIIFLEAVQDYGGARASTLELASRLQSAGHAVLIVDVWGADQEFIQKAERLALPFHVLSARRKPFLLTSKSRFGSILNSILYYKLNNEYRNKFRDLASSFCPDIVSVNNIKCLAILERKSSYTIDYFVRTWFLSRQIKLKTKVLLKWYRPRYVTVSQSTRQAVYGAGLAELDKIRVLHSVISKSVFYSHTPEYEKFSNARPVSIIQVGGFLPSKGQEIAVLIASELRRRDIPFRMTLIGVIYKGAESVRYHERILSLIDRYGLSDIVDVVVNNHNVLSYFKHADLLVHPSSTEGLPRVALEAMAFGLPVIANPVGGVTDVVIHNHTGYIADFNDVEQYVDYVSRYFDEAIYKRHSKNARALIESGYLDVNQEELISKVFR